MSEFSQRLQMLIDLKKINQKELVDGTKFDKAQVSNWISGNVKMPRRSTIRELADFFDCNIDWLATGNGEPFAKSNNVTVQMSDQVKNGPHKSRGKGWKIQDKETAEMEQISFVNKPPTKMVRSYRKLAEMDADTLGEIQTWLNDMERLRPGFTGWFRLEFQNRFPEFDEWKNNLFKKKANGEDS